MRAAREPLLAADPEAGGAFPVPPSSPEAATAFSPFPRHPASAAPSPAAPGSAFSFPRGPPPGVLAAQRRAWRGGVLDCCGYCSSSDCYSCALATFLPCVAWAHNQHRAFDLSFVAQLCLYLFLVYALRAAAVSVIASCQLSDASSSAGCHVASTLSGSVYFAAASAFALYAAWRRGALRRRFGLPGGPCGDACGWLCCGPCALCQETRTLAHNRVEAGFWLGPLPREARARDGTAEGFITSSHHAGAAPPLPAQGRHPYENAAAYPYDYVPTALGSPPPPPLQAPPPQPAFIVPGTEPRCGSDI